MQLSSLRHSIARKLLTIVFSLYTIVTVGLTGLHMYLEYRNANEAILKELKFYASMIAPSLSESLWNFSTDAVQSVIQGITKSPSVVGVKVTSSRDDLWRAGFATEKDETGQMYYFSPKSGEKDETRIFNATPFNYNEDITFKDESGGVYVVGHLSLYSSSSIVFGQVKEAFIIILVNAVIKVVALWVLFLIYGYKLLTKPLTALTAATQKVRQGDFAIEPLQVASSWPTEIEILNDNFNVMTTDLNNAQQTLIEAKSRIKSIIDSMPSMIIGMDNNHKISDWNAKISDFTKIEAEKTKDQDFFSTIPAYQFIKDEILNVEKTNTMSLLEKQTVYFDNKRYTQDILIYPLQSDKNPGIVVRIDDISAKMQLEQAIVQKEKLSSVGALAAGMAHQMTSPVGALSQHLQNIHRRLDPGLDGNKEVAQELKLSIEDIRSYLEKRKILGFIDQMDESVQEIAKSLESILAFSKPSSALKENMSFIKMFDHVLELTKSDYDLSKKMSFAEVQIEKTFAPEDKMLYLSKVEMEQALLGLIKFSASQMRYVNYQRKMLFESQVIDNLYVFRLKDNSEPLSAEDIAQIFDPLFSKKMQGESIHTGLSVVHQIITNSHGGSISVLSDPQSKGMIYEIKLPLGTERS